MSLSTLIDKQDNFEIIRDQIGSILVNEVNNQKSLATAGGKDPELWALRVFLERSNPWEIFADIDSAKYPIINISLDSMTYDKNKSDRTQRQYATSVFNIDIYGYGESTVNVTGHTPGDRLAALEAQRAYRLVRNILMAAENKYLALRKTVWDRFITSTEMFQPPITNDNVIKVLGSRIKFEVEHNEFSPQVELETLELVTNTVINSEGEVLLKANYDYS